MKRKLSMLLGVVMFALAGCSSAAPSSNTTTTNQQTQNQTPASTANIISEDEAKQAALQDAGVQEADTTGFRIRLETDDGVQEYEIDFYANGQEYEYSIAAADGSIRNKSVEAGNIGAGTSSNGISEEQAKQIALAKVTGAQDSDIRIKLDNDNGKQVYEGSIIYNKIEYEFEINAADGTILSWEEDSIYD